MAEVLYGHATEVAALRGSERVFDLYCGIGTIGLSLATRAREVIGVEIVEPAVADAIENARLNEITNASFFAGDIRLAMRDLVEQAGKPDVAVIDPPRAGLSQKVVRRIIEAAPAADRLRVLQPDDARAERGAARRGGLDAQARATGRHVPADAAHRVRRAAGARVSVHRVARMFGMVNAFLVEEDDGLTLIDTAIGGRDAKAILAEASKLGRPIVRIALTHAHQDHIGGLDALAAELPGAEVLISTRDAKLLAKDTTPEPGEPADAKLRGGYSGAKTKPTRLLEPGDRVGSLEVVAAPGHTPGQIAFMDTRDRTLIAGDAFSTLGGVATTAKPNPRFPMPALATWHRPTALATARSLRALDPARLAVGHGKTVENPGAAMDAAIA